MDLTSIASILVNIIQVKYQGLSISPFETHPVATRVAICSLLLHFLLHFANRAPPSSGRAPSCDGAAHLLFHFTGLTSVFSLVWLLLHDFFHSVLWFMLLLLLSVSLLHGLLQKLWLWFYRKLLLLIIRAACSHVWHGGRAQPFWLRPVVGQRFMLEV
ncbi:hypothetical protein BT93_D0366 [Corymbia citriodora subsp. variegata]|nr:hypothetical protein BT93_D0366 [Corymbia citriodora subsp. variegata]